MAITALILDSSPYPPLYSRRLRSALSTDPSRSIPAWGGAASYSFRVKFGGEAGACPYMVITALILDSSPRRLSSAERLLEHEAHVARGSNLTTEGTRQAPARRDARGRSARGNSPVSPQTSLSRSPPVARTNTRDSSAARRLGTVRVVVEAVRGLAGGCEQARVCVDLRSMFQEFDTNQNGRIER